MVWPHKDCVLEGGQTKEDAKRNEIFYNQTLAPDDIDRLTAPKVLTKWKRYDKEGEHPVTKISKQDNLIIKGNNLLALHSLIEIYRGQVKLIYIDPPYNTGDDEFGYNDSFNHSTWLTFIKNRLEIAKELLDNEGVIFVQINDIEFGYLKVLLDEIFERENFHTSITVKMSHLSGTKMAHKEKKLPKIKEHILMYSKNRSFLKLNPVYVPCSWDDAFDRYNSFLLKNDTGDNNCNEWQVVSVNQALKQNKINIDAEKAVLEFKMKNAHLIFRTARNRSADYSNLPKDKFSKIEKNEQQPEDYYFVYKGEDVNFAKEKIRNINGKDTPTSAVGDIWTDIGINNLSNEGGVELRFGKKPEKLIHRIISLTTKENDLVLDFFLGSGSTAAVAHKMGRRYIGIEQLNYVEGDCVKRLQNVIGGENIALSKEILWNGGGSFIYFELLKNNQQYIDSIQSATETEQLKKLWAQMQQSAFISYKVSPQKINSQIKEFETLGFEDQQRFLVEVLDKNLLYVNYSEINDAIYKVSEADKELNVNFYSMLSK